MSPEPRNKLKRTGVCDKDGNPFYVFTHDCCVCGAPDAPYGEGVSLLTDKGGKWYCRTHWKQHVAGADNAQHSGQ